MGFELFKAFGTLALEGGEVLGRSLKQVETQAGIAAQKLQDISQASDHLGKELTKNLTVPILGVIGAVSALALRTIGFVRNLRQVSTQLGISIRDLQVFREAFNGILTEEQSNSVLTTLRNGVNEFIANGGGPLAEFFDDIGRRFGITAQRFREMSTADQLQTLFRTLERGSRSAAQFEARVAALGPQFTALLATYREGPEAFRRAFEEAADSPNLVSDRMIQLSEQWDQTWSRVTSRVDRAWNALSEAALPVMIRVVEIGEQTLVPMLETVIAKIGELSEWFINLGSSTQEWILLAGAAAIAIGPILVAFAGLIKVIAFVVSGFGILVGVIAALTASPIALFVALVGVFFGIFYNLIQQGIQLWNQWKDTIFNALSAVGSFFSSTVPAWVQSWSQWGQEIFTVFTEWFSRLPDAIMGFISNMASRVAGRIRQMASDIGDTLSALYDRVVGNSIIPDMASEVVDEVSNMANGSLAETRRMAQGMSRSLDGISRPDLDPTSAAGLRGQAPVVFNMNHSIFRDDRDMLDQARLRGAVPTGAF